MSSEKNSLGINSFEVPRKLLYVLLWTSSMSFLAVLQTINIFNFLFEQYWYTMLNIISQVQVHKRQILYQRTSNQYNKQKYWCKMYFNNAGHHFLFHFDVWIINNQQCYAKNNKLILIIVTFYCIISLLILGYNLK